MYSFAKQKNEWKRLPVDELGYITAEDLLKLSDDELIKTIQTARDNRFNGWRNYKNMWRETLGHDTTKGKSILDFGCGIGLETVEFAKNNIVSIADLHKDNLDLVSRVATLFGVKIRDRFQITSKYPFIKTEKVFDIFYSNGVIHHIEYAYDIIKRAFELAPEVRMMLYSDIGRKMYPDDNTFIREFDAVGNYADWYSLEKIEKTFGDLATIKNFSYITKDNRYLTVTLIKK